MKKDENKSTLSAQDLDQVSGGVGEANSTITPSVQDIEKKLDARAQELYRKNFNELTLEEKTMLFDPVLRANTVKKGEDPRIMKG